MGDVGVALTRAETGRELRATIASAPAKRQLLGGNSDSLYGRSWPVAAVRQLVLLTLSRRSRAVALRHQVCMRSFSGALWVGGSFFGNRRCHPRSDELGLITFGVN